MAAALALVCAVLLGLGALARAIATAPVDPHYGDADPNRVPDDEASWT